MNFSLGTDPPVADPRIQRWLRSAEDAIRAEMETDEFRAEALKAQHQLLVHGRVVLQNGRVVDLGA